MSSPAPDDIVRRGDVLWRRTLDGVLIRRRGDPEVVLLAGTGVALWETLDSPRPVADLAARLATAHDADRREVERDLGGIVDELVASGVLALG